MPFALLISSESQILGNLIWNSWKTESQINFPDIPNLILIWNSWKIGKLIWIFPVSAVPPADEATVVRRWQKVVRRRQLAVPGVASAAADAAAAVTTAAMAALPPRWQWPSVLGTGAEWMQCIQNHFSDLMELNGPLVGGTTFECKKTFNCNQRKMLYFPCIGLMQLYLT